MIGNPNRFMPNYPEGKIFVFTKIGKFQSGIQTIERKSSSIFSPKAKVIAIVKAAKPVVFTHRACLFITGKDKFQSKMQTLFEQKSSSSGLRKAV